VISVELPGLTLTNAPGQSREYLRDLTGWFDGVDPDTKTKKRPRGDGFFGVRRTYKKGRAVVAEGGLIRLGDPAYLFELRDRVMALQNIPGSFMVTVRDPTGPWSAEVEIGGKPLFTIEDEDGVAEFEVPLFNRDGRKYGQPLQVGPEGPPTSGGGITSPITSPVTAGPRGTLGRIVTVNEGRADTWSIVDVRGGLELGFELQCIETGDIVRFERVVPEGSTVRIDLKKMTAVLDEINSVGSFALTRREGWHVPPGGIRTIQFKPLGAITGTPTFTAFTPPAKF
jgi:hypothetical protein